MTEHAKKLLLLYYKQSRKIRRVSGLPPLTFKAKKAGTLKNYRIYGQTVDGESVGDRTGNLFDSNINVISGYLSDEGILKPAKETSQITFDYIPIISGTYTFTYTVPSAYELWFGVCTYDESRTFQSRLVSEYSGAATFTIPDTTKYIRISLRGYNETPIIMLNEGSTALPYEPYGYKVPVTVEGKNLCNNIWEQGGIDGNTGNVVPNSNIVCCDFIPVKPDVTYSCSRTIANDFINLRCYGANKNYLGTGATLANKGNPLAYGDLFGTFMITDARVSYIRFNDYSNSLDTKYMLVEGVYTAETMPPYEPVTTNLYLPEPIKMVGDEAEYIDYAEQKMHRIGADDIDVTLPALPVLPGTNTLTVGTEVQPSGVEIKGRIKAAGGD